MVECRIAGGWVRDKVGHFPHVKIEVEDCSQLLSLPSNDLDIALSISSGHAFAVAFVDFLRDRSVPVGTVGRVAANPEQSKHLETGTTTIMGLGCDFVGLRCETYADSRIPSRVVSRATNQHAAHQQELGTPFEDASRRDLTINALFYNVHSKEVEDFTKLGLIDLANKVARTPLPPRQTFDDDPLRVLRCIRFASRFNLTIEDDVMNAMRDPQVKVSDHHARPQLSSSLRFVRKFQRSALVSKFPR